MGWACLEAGVELLEQAQKYHVYVGLNSWVVAL